MTSNAGFFLWLDLSSHLPVHDTNGDDWAAERLLSSRLQSAGVVMSSGEAYHAQEPGRFRLVFSLEENTVREGIARYFYFLYQTDWKDELTCETRISRVLKKQAGDQ